MSDSEDSTVTYTELSSPFEGLSDIGSPGVVGPEHEGLPWMLDDPYVQEDPEDDDDKDPEEDPANYLANEGDDSDDEDESSDDDEDDDVDIKGDDEEEEEHPTPADFIAVAFPAVDQAPSAEEIEPFKTDESAATPPPHPAYRIIARISIRDETPISLPSREEVERLLVIPTPPSSPLSPWSSPLPQIPSPLPPILSPPLPISSLSLPASPIYPLGYRAAMIRLRAKIPSTSHPTQLGTPPSGTPPLLPTPAPTSSPLLMLPSADHGADRPEVCLPPQKRLCFAFGPRQDLEREVGYGITDTWDDMVEDMQETPVVTDVAELSQSMKDFGTTIRQDTDKIYRRLDNAHSERQLMAGRLNMLYRDRRAHARTELQAADCRRQAAISELLAVDHKRQAWFIKALKLLNRLQTQMTEFKRQQGPAKGPAQPDAPKEKMAPKRTMRSKPSQKQPTHISQLMPASGTERAARECTYTEFLKCQPLNFKDTKGVVGLSQWFERMESVFHIIGQMPLTDLKVKGTDLTSYTQRFQELALLCGRMFPEESDKIEKYVGGLPDMIYGSVVASKPKTMQDAEYGQMLTMLTILERAPGGSEDPTCFVVCKPRAFKREVSKAKEPTCWELRLPILGVIQNGNGHVSITTDTKGQNKVFAPRTAEEIIARGKESRKVRTTLLMAYQKIILLNYMMMMQKNIGMPSNLDLVEMTNPEDAEVYLEAKLDQSLEEDEDYALMALQQAQNQSTGVTSCSTTCLKKVESTLLLINKSQLCTEPFELVSEPVVNELMLDVKPKVWSDAPIFEEYDQIVKYDLNHLIRDCDFHEKRMARKAELNNGWNRKSSQREIRQTWNNVQRLPDENQVLLKIPRQNNMYSFNLENIVSSGGLASLIANAIIDESNKWHKRLGHVNFKNLNKLVKGNLVRVADFINLETVVNVSPIPTSRIISSHPSALILGDPTSAVQTRSKVNKSFRAYAFVSYVQKQRGRKEGGGERHNLRTSDCLFAYFRKELLSSRYIKYSTSRFCLWEEGLLDERGFIEIEDERELLSEIASYQMDLKSAFLYGKIDEEVYVSQPLGFLDPKYPQKVYKVVKALYGLHQAPRAWHDGRVDSDEFYGRAHFSFLDYTSNRMQIGTACNLLRLKAFSQDEEASDVDVYLYRSMIGSLMYLTASRPDIMYLKGKPNWVAAVVFGILECPHLTGILSDSDDAGQSKSLQKSTKEVVQIFLAGTHFCNAKAETWLLLLQSGICVFRDLQSTIVDPLECMTEYREGSLTDDRARVCSRDMQLIVCMQERYRCPQTACGQKPLVVLRGGCVPAVYPACIVDFMHQCVLIEKWSLCCCVSADNLFQSLIQEKQRGRRIIEGGDESESESDGILEAEKKFKQLASDEEMARKEIQHLIFETKKSLRGYIQSSVEKIKTSDALVAELDIGYQEWIPEGFDRVLWGDLMIMFNPDDEDKFWNSQQD
ncbi:putative reverse transcriptase domain-containing protein [Tanacetum coccineum]